MKKILLGAAILFSCLVYQSADAQIHINLGLNIGNQPDWGPVGYNHAEYYYIPDIDAYYDVPNHQYVYMQNNAWVHAGVLPTQYRNYDLYHGYKVVVNERNPWEHHAAIRARYAGFRGRHDQPVIRDSHDRKYANHWRGGNGQQRDGNYGQDGHRQDGRGQNGYGQGGRGQDAHGQDRGQDGRGQDNHGQGGHGQDQGHDDRGHGRP